MLGFDRESRSLVGMVWLAAGCAAVSQSATPLRSPSLGSFALLRTLGPGIEWRFEPLVIDLNRDGHLDLVATARLAKPALHIWLGDGTGGLSPVNPTWTDIGYGALATGDINGDAFPDIVAASHFGGVQTLLSDGRGGFTEIVLRREDGYVGAQLADLNSDGDLDLILLGYRNAGIEVHFGDGTGQWMVHRTIPETRPGRTMAGRAVVLGDLNHDGHLDLVAAFQRWGIYIYYGDGQGGFTGGSVGGFSSVSREFQSVVLADVNQDGHLDLVINGTLATPNQLNGPDVYLGDGRGGWSNSSAGLKSLKFASAGLAVGDLDRDGNLDIVASGSVTGVAQSDGLFWYRGDGKGKWRLARDSGLPPSGLSLVHSITLADLDRDGFLEIIALSGGTNGSITIWKRR